LHYAKDIVNVSDNSVEVCCIFDTLPTLAMFIEAAAQSSIAFDQDKQVKIGFLTTVKDVILLSDIVEMEYLFVLKKIAEIGEFRQFSFLAIGNEGNLETVSGYFTIIVKE